MASIEKVKQYRFFAKAANMRFSVYRAAVFETIVRGSPPREFEVAIQAVRNKGKRSPAAAAAGTAGECHLTAQTAAGPGLLSAALVRRGYSADHAARTVRRSFGRFGPVCTAGAGGLTVHDQGGRDDFANLWRPLTALPRSGRFSDSAAKRVWHDGDGASEDVPAQAWELKTGRSGLMNSPNPIFHRRNAFDNVKPCHRKKVPPAGGIGVMGSSLQAAF